MKKESITEKIIGILILGVIILILFFSLRERMEIEKIDGCEYITINNFYSSAIVHKANCKNHNNKGNENEKTN